MRDAPGSPSPAVDERLLGRPHSGERTQRDDIDVLLALTVDADAGVRRAAAWRLCPCHVQHNDGRVWDRLIAMTGDGDVKVRRTILHALGDGSPRERESEVLEAVERLAADDDAKLRRRARKLLAHHRRTGQINIL